MPEPERLTLSIAEAAQALGVSRAHLYVLMSNGTIPSLHLGGRHLISKAALAAVLEGDAVAEVGR